jgi:hypothetical protein
VYIYYLHFCLSHIYHIQGLFYSRLGTADYALLLTSNWRHNGSPDVWMVVNMTAAKFKPFIFPVSGFALSNIARIFVFMIFVWLLLAAECHGFHTCPLYITQANLTETWSLLLSCVTLCIATWLGFDILLCFPWGQLSNSAFHLPFCFLLGAALNHLPLSPLMSRHGLLNSTLHFHSCAIVEAEPEEASLPLSPHAFMRDRGNNF